MKPLVSIVVPIYNVEKYLRKCLNSIVNQTYKDIEVILINDGSTDNSARICDDFAQNDNRIRVIHNKNQGVSYSRNQGINLAKGEYILFIDSDDDISMHYVEQLVANTTAGIDLVICGIEDIYENCRFPKDIKWRKISSNLSGKIEDDFYTLINYTRVPFAKLFKTEILKKYKIYFPANISFSEDQIFNLDYFYRIQNYKFINKELYRHYHRDNNSLSSKKTLTNFYTYIKTLQIMDNFLQNKHVYLKETIFLNEIINVMIMFSRLSENKDSFLKLKQRVKELNRIVDKKYYSKYSHKKISFKRNIIIKLMEYNMNCLVAIMLVLKRWSNQ